MTDHDPTRDRYLNAATAATLVILAAPVVAVILAVTVRLFRWIAG